MKPNFLLMLRAFAIMCMLTANSSLLARACVRPVTISCPTVDCDINVVHIAQSNVGPAGYVISAPGRYCFIEDITFTPSGPGTATVPVAGITITSSNVELDLNNYTFTGPTGVPNVVGIKVASASLPLTNVIIHGGTIQNFTLAIFVDPVNNMLLENLWLTNNGKIGALSIGNQNSPSVPPVAPFTVVGGLAVIGTGVPGSPPSTTQNNIIIRNVHANFNGGTTSSSTTYGTLLANVGNVLVENSEFNNNWSVTSVGRGFAASQFANLSVIDATAHNNSGVSQGIGFTFVGSRDAAFSQFSTALYIDRASANGNYISGVAPLVSPFNVFLAAGFLYANVRGATTRASEASDNFTALTGAQLPQRASGFEMYYSTDWLFEHDVANNNTGGTSYGFHLNGQRGRVYRSQATHVSTNPLPGAGFAVETYRNESGAGLTMTSQALKFEEVYATNYDYGIRLTDVVWSIIEDSEFINNNIDGIFLSQTDECGTRRNIIKRNQVIGNLVWGIEDTSGAFSGLTGPDNAYIDNHAMDNRPLVAPGIPGTTNYNTGVHLAGADGPGYIAIWTIPGPPPNGPTGLNKITNLDITTITCPVAVEPG